MKPPSIHAGHAAAGAIKELVHQYAVADGLEHVARDWARNRQHLTKYPRLLRCMEMSLDCDHPTRVRSIAMPADPAPRDLDAHLTHLQSACRDAGYPVWLRTLHATESGVELVCAAMPRMELFLHRVAGRLRGSLSSSRSLPGYLNDRS